MFGSVPSSGLSLGKIISGISKSLSVVNQLLPLYREIKPVIGNAKTILSTLKEVGSVKAISSQKIINQSDPNNTKDTSINESISSNNQPVFFN